MSRGKLRRYYRHGLLQQLLVFEAVARLGQVTRAADDSFPFQSATGIHTSLLMSESVDGVSVTATRQKAGSVLKAAALTGPSVAPGGGTNVPGGTSVAAVTRP